jgi:hypothetical protein
VKMGIAEVGAEIFDEMEPELHKIGVKIET